MSRLVQIALHTNRPLGTSSSPETLLALTPLGLVVSEHIDKIGFFEPSVRVRDKEIAPDRVTFTLLCADTLAKPLEEIVRGFRIGCFRIAREYGLVSPEDPTPIFSEGFAVKELTPEARAYFVHRLIRAARQ